MDLSCNPNFLVCDYNDINSKKFITFLEVLFKNKDLQMLDLQDTGLNQNHLDIFIVAIKFSPINLKKIETLYNFSFDS